MNATATPRLKKVHEWVIREALVLMLTNIVQACDETFEQIGDETSLDIENIAATLSSELFAELWPTDEEADSREHALASARAEAIASSVLANLTSHKVREHLLAESVRLGTFHSVALAKLQASEA